MKTEGPAHYLKDGDETDLIRYLDKVAPGRSEDAYERLTAYAFARRYVGGKNVAEIGRQGLGYGSRLLAETAESLTVLTDAAEAADLARSVHSAPNMRYQSIDSLASMPYAEGHFDVVAALWVMDDLKEPERLVEEAKRVLKRDGTLVVSVSDKRLVTEDRDRGGADRRRGMYAPELRDLLQKHFGDVRLYRQGAVAGGLVLPESPEMVGARPESARFSLLDPRAEAEPPPARSILAVCGDAEAFGQEEQPYLLLDRDRRVFDECEDRAEDVELLQDEIRRMQETEAQAFQDALKLHRSEIAYLRAQVRRIPNLERRIHEMENAATWRVFEPYRRLRARMDVVKDRVSGGKG